MIRKILVLIFFSPLAFAYEPVTRGTCGALALPKACSQISTYCSDVHLDGCLGGEDDDGYAACVEHFTESLGGIRGTKLKTKPNDPYGVYCGVECFNKVAKTVREMSKINLDGAEGLEIDSIRLAGLSDSFLYPHEEMFLFRVDTTFQGGYGQFEVMTRRSAKSCQVLDWALTDHD